MSTLGTVMVVLPKVWAYVDTDLNKRYSLLEPWHLKLLKPLPGVFDNAEVNAEGTDLWIKPFKSTKGNPVCDGNTLVPEEILGIKTEIGSLAHDPLYRALEAFAQAMGWTVAQARRFFDEIYGNILLELARREPNAVTRKLGIAWAHISYAGVRLLGGLGHAAYNLGVVALACSACMGASGGCMGEVIEPDFPLPVYRQEKTEVTTAAEARRQIDNITNDLRKATEAVEKIRK